MRIREIAQEFADCKTELLDVKAILAGPPSTKLNRTTKYLTDYSIIRACSSIDYSYKHVISTFFGENQRVEIKNFIDHTVVDDHSHPHLSKMYKTLGNFDEALSSKFRHEIETHPNYNKMTTSLSSLIRNRHAVAHGRSHTTSLQTVILYYEDSRRIIQILENVLYMTKTFEDALKMFNET